MIIFLSCSGPSGDNTPPPPYKQSISSLQIPKKLPPININTDHSTKTSSLRGPRDLSLYFLAEHFNSKCVWLKLRKFTHRLS